ncbi:M28 family peptidase [Pimelobacter simplex]|uniref:M28 family peptidase n=1 Tax=Nocardioides simplex TaxID=2045 RepID=UPI00193425B6|nr:M28 family peptidase [Pimelobacter simplex]
MIATTPDVAETDRLLATIEDLVAMAPRATGTPGGEQAAAYVAERFRSAGLDEVWVEEADSFAWEPHHTTLHVDGVEVACAPIRHCALPGHEHVGMLGTGPGGIEADVVDIGADRVGAHDVAGRIVLFDLTFDLPQWALLPLSEYVHDPDRRMLNREALASRNPYLTSLTRTMREAAAAGALGVVGVLRDYPESLGYHNEYYRRTLLTLPGAWITRSTGEAVRRRLRTGSVARLRLVAERRRVTARTVVGVLHGASAETIMVQSHHDSIGPGAVEDASGTAEVVALAEHAVARARSGRPWRKTLMFVTFDSHFTGYQSHRAFARRYTIDPGSPYRLALNLTVEHVGLRARRTASGGLETLDHSEPRAFFENVSVPMKLALARAIRRHGLGATSMLNANVLEFTLDGIPTDASFTFTAGVPTISLVSGPLYLYDAADTVDKIDADQLVPVANAFAELMAAADTRAAGRLGLVPRAVRRRLPRGRW